MRVSTRNIPIHSDQRTQEAQQVRRPDAVRSGSAGSASGVASSPGSFSGTYQLSVSVSELMQAARSGKVSSAEFDRRLSDIAGGLLQPGMSATEKGRSIHLVARLADLENQLVTRLQGNEADGEPNTIGLQITDWANRFAEANGVTLQPGYAPSGGTLLERKV